MLIDFVKNTLQSQKLTQFDVTIISKEQISSLKISMDHFVSMQKIQTLNTCKITGERHSFLIFVVEIVCLWHKMTLLLFITCRFYYAEILTC